MQMRVPPGDPSLSLWGPPPEGEQNGDKLSSLSAAQILTREQNKCCWYFQPLSLEVFCYAAIDSWSWLMYTLTRCHRQTPSLACSGQWARSDSIVFWKLPCHNTFSISFMACITICKYSLHLLIACFLYLCLENWSPLGPLMLLSFLLLSA